MYQILYLNLPAVWISISHNCTEWCYTSIIYDVSSVFKFKFCQNGWAMSHNSMKSYWRLKFPDANDVDEIEIPMESSQMSARCMRVKKSLWLLTIKCALLPLDRTAANFLKHMLAGALLIYVTTLTLEKQMGQAERLTDTRPLLCAYVFGHSQHNSSVYLE